MKREIDNRMAPVLEMMEAKLPCAEFAITVVVMDQRGGKKDEISVYGNREGHGKYHLLEHALEQESSMPASPQSDLPDAIQMLNARIKGKIQ